MHRTLGFSSDEIPMGSCIAMENIIFIKIFLEWSIVEQQSYRNLLGISFLELLQKLIIEFYKIYHFRKNIGKKSRQNLFYKKLFPKYTLSPHRSPGVLLINVFFGSFFFFALKMAIVSSTK